MSIVEITQENFEKEVLKASEPVLVDFNAVWCPPCQALHPILEELADEADGFKVCAVDVDEQGELARQYDISTIPCLIVFEGGAEKTRGIGLKPKKKLLKMLGK